MKRVYVVGTADTKGEELDFLARAVEDALGGAGLGVTRVDVGTRPADTRFAMDVPAQAVAAFHPDGESAVLGLSDRGEAVTAMAEALERFLASRDDLAAVIGIGGGGGTAIVSQAMRALPLGLPKLIVSTLASGDTAPYVGISDLVMMPSVTDMAGLNSISRTVLGNAARAIAGMAVRPADTAAQAAKPSLGLSMFGVTTPCVMAIVDQLKDEYDCAVFHATGTGGRTMEKLADGGFLSGLLDITTTEVADFLLGGVLPATEDRFGALRRTGLPAVVSVGACDMANFWAFDTVPAQFRDRTLYRHNANVTLMRTNAEECRRIGAWIGERLRDCRGPLTVLIPEKGVSALDIEGGAFWDPEADGALFESLEQAIGPSARVERLPLHINDPAFAQAAVAAFRALA